MYEHVNDITCNMESWDQSENSRWDVTEEMFTFQWEYYAIIKNENKPMMDYYVKKAN